MNETPKALRLHIGIFGRANSGKSSFVNLITGQNTSIVSPVAGTTTDVVRKSMELLPLGPVTFLDTAGIDDATELGPLRVARTREALASSDVACLVVEPGTWTDYEKDLAADAARQNTPLIVVVNKVDLAEPSTEWLASLASPDSLKPLAPLASLASRTSISAKPAKVMTLSCLRANADPKAREEAIVEFKRLLVDVCPDSFLEPPAILGDLLPSSSRLPLVVLIVPIDLQAPKGRLILPQVQSIRDALDSDAAVMVVKEREYRALLESLSRKPDLVVCDSQVALKMVADTPADVPCTTFSILFSRFKGNVELMARGAAAIERLRDGDRVLMSEACTHHALEDDIGRVKIPRWLREYSGLDLSIEHVSGKDYPANLTEYSLIVHCGSCTLTRRETLMRIELARLSSVPITNYGMAISALQGVIERTLSPFPLALEAYREALTIPQGDAP